MYCYSTTTCICVAKTKTLISHAVCTTDLCLFIYFFYYAGCWFSDAVAHMFYLNVVNFKGREKMIHKKSHLRSNQRTSNK